MRIGIISDTHIPARWPALPEALGRVFAGVDLILHAGDVGELWVLDDLSAIAPVVAVHGNDDSADAQRELPYQQVLAMGGRRVLLWHSHFEDRAEELASRKVDSWERVLRRSAERAKRAGAQLALFGHTHVPMARMYDGLLLVNGGAIASGNYITRQTRQTVAMLTLGLGTGESEVRHVDLAAPEARYEAQVDWEAGFNAALARYQESILAPELREQMAGLGPESFEKPLAVMKALAPLSREVWSGARQWITGEALWEAVQQGAVSEQNRMLLRDLMARAREGATG